MSKQIELEILEAVLKRHLTSPVKFLCIEVSTQTYDRGLEHRAYVSTALRTEILEFLDGEETVESYVYRSHAEDCVSTDHPEVVAMRTHILETMIARRKS